MKIFRRVSGLLTIIATIVGLIVGIAGIFGIWAVLPSLTQTLVGNLLPLKTSLSATADGLAVAQDSLTNARASLTSVEGVTLGVADTLSDTAPALLVSANLLGKDLPASFAAAQEGMETAQFGAKAIDTTLRTLSTVPLIGPSIGYNPPTPLDQSLADVAKSLEPIPKSFGTIEKSLRSTTENLGTVETNIRDLGASLKQIDTSVAGAQDVIAQYQTVVGGLQDNLKGTENSIPNLLNTVAWVVTALLIWFCITQLALLYQGIELLTEDGFNESKLSKLIDREVAESLPQPAAADTTAKE